MAKQIFWVFFAGAFVTVTWLFVIMVYKPSQVRNVQFNNGNVVYRPPTVSLEQQSSLSKRFEYTSVSCLNGSFPYDPMQGPGTYPASENDRRRTCMWKNMYIYNGGFLAIVDPSFALTPQDYSVYDSGIHTYQWRPDIKTVTIDELKIMSESEVFLELPGFSVLLRGLWNLNYGHGIYDNLWPVFTSMIRWGREMDTFRALYYPDSKLCNGERCFADVVIEKFAGAKLVNIAKMREEKLFPVDTYVKLPEFLAGCGDSAARFNTANISIYGGKELNATALFRQRMYNRYGVTEPRSRVVDAPRTSSTRRQNSDIKAIVIENKRFTEAEKDMLNKVIEQLTAEKYSIQYIRWPSLTYEGQLKLLADTDIYISGPGTGLLMHPLMAEGTVLINLGGIHRDARQRQYVTYMEEYFAESSPMIRALYYPANLRFPEMTYNDTMKLIKSAYEIMATGISTPAQPGDNLSVISKIFKEYCYADVHDCQILLSEFNGLVRPYTTSAGEQYHSKWQCLVDAWTSVFVQEKDQYGPDGVANEQNEESHCWVNRPLLRSIRGKYASLLAATYPTA